MVLQHNTDKSTKKQTRLAEGSLLPRLKYILLSISGVVGGNVKYKLCSILISEKNVNIPTLCFSSSAHLLKCFYSKLSLLYIHIFQTVKNKHFTMNPFLSRHFMGEIMNPLFL